jgi:hypothetical protein
MRVLLVLLIWLGSYAVVVIILVERGNHTQSATYSCSAVEI